MTHNVQKCSETNKAPAALCGLSLILAPLGGKHFSLTLSFTCLLGKMVMPSTAGFLCGQQEAAPKCRGCSGDPLPCLGVCL
jgi:hypothetical protein